MITIPPPPFVDALVIDPQTPTTLYAGTSSKGLYKSTDGSPRQRSCS